MEAIARDHGLRLVSLTKSGCPLISTTLPSPTNAGGDYTECGTWNEAVLARINAENPDLVVVSGSREMLRDHIGCDVGGYGWYRRSRWELDQRHGRHRRCRRNCDHRQGGVDGKRRRGRPRWRLDVGTRR